MSRSQTGAVAGGTDRYHSRMATTDASQADSTYAAKV